MMMSTLLRRTRANPTEAQASDTPKHLGWIMMTAMGIGATIGAGIFAMPGMIAQKAGPAGILSFLLTGIIILFVGISYERFSRVVPNGVSAYSYVYHSMGEIFAWIVAFGLFLEYSFGASAVAIAWSVYLQKAFSFKMPEFWAGPMYVKTLDGGSEFHFGINIIALSAVALVTLICMYGGVSKSAKLNFALVLLKMTLLLVFLVAGLKHLNLSNLTPFMPMGIEGVLRGAALAVFPYVGFDALFTFARESKSLKDTSRATFLCIGIVAFLYVAVMFVACCLAPAFLPDAAAAGGFSPNPQFAGNEASAPLAVLMSAAGEDWIARLIAGGAVLGIFNVLLVLSMGGPRIFRNMAEDGLLPPIFQKTHKGNPTVGLAINGIIVGLMAGFVPFGDIAEMMVLGTLVAFIFVCIGAMRMKLVSPLIALPGAIGCTILTAFLGDLVLKTYCITLPVGLVIYFLYGRKHSRLNNEPSLVYEESK